MANSARENGDPERDLFLSAVQDATPLRDRNRAPNDARARRRPPPAAARTLVVERDGESVEGRAHGVTREQLAELRRGKVAVDATLDLHHDDRDSALRRLRRFLDDSASCGRRCVLVVHGRGHHSAGGPVLPETVIAALSTSALVRGFATARPVDGGPGATYVLLKEKR